MKKPQGNECGSRRKKGKTRGVAEKAFLSIAMRAARSGAFYNAGWWRGENTKKPSWRIAWISS
jgi:hypothetical protein